jgi:hypothetical protein
MQGKNRFFFLCEEWRPIADDDRIIKYIQNSLLFKLFSVSDPSGFNIIGEGCETKQYTYRDDASPYDIEMVVMHDSRCAKYDWQI